jgi:hypothetical protein
MKAPPPTRDARDGDGGDDDELASSAKTILRLLPSNQIKYSCVIAVFAINVI